MLKNKNNAIIEQAMDDLGCSTREELADRINQVLGEEVVTPAFVASWGSRFPGYWMLRWMAEKNHGAVGKMAKGLLEVKG